MNECGACGEDFSSVAMFDRHRVGVHAYTYSEGIAMEPMREDGRRCLVLVEMTAKRWRKDARGRWCDPASIEAVRRAFGASQFAAETTEGPRTVSV